jgi:maltokinase
MSTVAPAIAPGDGESAELAQRHAPDLVSSGHERPITVDQTNHSVVVDESVIVKWFRPPIRSHDRLTVVDHLRAVGFGSMPTYFGAEEVDGYVVATVSEYLGGAHDGWEWFVGAMVDWADGVVPSESVLTDAMRIGTLAAEMHVALTTPSTVVRRPVTEVDASTERDRCRTLLTEAYAEITDRAARMVLDRAADRIARCIEAMPTGPTPACMLHGDLHVGQILKTPDGRLVVTDFDGNPLLDAIERRRFRPLAVDLASLVQSVDHAGRVAQRRRPEATALGEMIARCCETTSTAHVDGLRGADRLHLVDARLLDGLRTAQELHELVYAERHLPRWSYAPAATLSAMFSSPAGSSPDVGV